MRLFYNYPARDIFGFECTINSECKLTEERIDKTFSHMKRHRNVDGFSAMGISDDNRCIASFCYDTISDWEQNLVSITYYRSSSERETKKCKTTVAKIIAKCFVDDDVDGIEDIWMNIA